LLDGSHDDSRQESTGSSRHPDDSDVTLMNTSSHLHYQRQHRVGFGPAWTHAASRIAGDRAVGSAGAVRIGRGDAPARRRWTAFTRKHVISLLEPGDPEGIGVFRPELLLVTVPARRALPGSPRLREELDIATMSMGWVEPIQSAPEYVSAAPTLSRNFKKIFDDEYPL
jgi:hypothetical protein